MAKDPVCNMNVEEKTAIYKTDYNGKTYYFCAASCKSTFEKDPAKFAINQTKNTGNSCGCGCGGH
ncbi:MAG: YHS domain-containing protein [Crenarchaeota archaeon]|mgnify:CR=1 FL=1|nr:YHS domain-containing protein [Thermoproteota archaeon]